MFQFIKSLFRDFLDLLFPTLCLGCGRSLVNSERVLCTPCRLNLPETGNHRSPYDATLLHMFAGSHSVRFVASYLYFTKGSVVQKLIHNIKYKGHKEAAQEIGNWYGEQLKAESELVMEADLIIGVPMHKSRLRQRGYNQADWIARGLAESLAIPTATDVLIRQQFRGSQTKKNRLERWENVKSVFAVLRPEAVIDKQIILVDDVLTTGATIEACAIELMNAGCRSVGVLTIAATHR